MLKKIGVLLMFIVSVHSYGQKEIGKINPELLENYLQEVYKEGKVNAIMGNPEMIAYYKSILKRIQFYDKISFPSEKKIINLDEIHTLKNFNSNTENNSPKNVNKFNIFKYKIDTENKVANYFSSTKIDYVICILPVQ